MGVVYPGEPSQLGAQNNAMPSSRLSRQISESEEGAYNSVRQSERTTGICAPSHLPSSATDHYSAEENSGRFEPSLPHDVPRTQSPSSRRTRWLIGSQEDQSNDLDGRRTPSVVSAPLRMRCEGYTNM